MDNYEKTVQAAKARFLTYDQEHMIAKFHLPADENFLYPTMLGTVHRLNRKDGNLQRQENGTWVSANSYNEVMTLLDLLCDSREDRHLSGRWLSTQNFGHQFHTALLEPGLDPLANAFDRHPECFRSACLSLGGRPVEHGDMGYAIELFDHLEIGVFFWLADEEFPAQLRFFWDENAAMYLKYETMHYALAVLRNALAQHLQEPENMLQ